MPILPAALPFAADFDPLPCNFYKDRAIPIGPQKTERRKAGEYIRIRMAEAIAVADWQHRD